MNVLKTEVGEVSKQNMFNILVLVAALFAALFPIWQPFIPPSAVPYILAVVASLNVVIRTFFSSGNQIQGVK